MRQDRISKAERDHTNFNPRTPCGVRRTVQLDHTKLSSISIHAPRAGCDIQRKANHARTSDFNPRTPCGVRLEKLRINFNAVLFQSTHPVRGATQSLFRYKGDLTIFQSTHPVRGATSARGLPMLLVLNFNPRTPCGVRRQTCTTWFAPIFATLPNQMYVCLHYTCFTTLFQPKTWFSAVFQRCEAPRESMSAPASHRVKASAAPPAHRSAWRRYAQRGSDSYSQDCKSASCPSPG